MDDHVTRNSRSSTIASCTLYGLLPCSYPADRRVGTRSQHSGRAITAPQIYNNSGYTVPEYKFLTYRPCRTDAIFIPLRNPKQKLKIAFGSPGKRPKGRHLTFRTAIRPPLYCIRYLRMLHQPLNALDDHKEASSYDPFLLICTMLNYVRAHIKLSDWKDR